MGARGKERKGVNYAEEENNNGGSAMSHCQPADGSGASDHGAHVERSDGLPWQGRSGDNSGVCARGSDPIHLHNAHAFLYVLEGSVVMQLKGGKEITLTPGQTFYEGPKDVHVVGRNASSTKPAKFLVFLVKNKGVPVLVPVK